MYMEDINNLNAVPSYKYLGDNFYVLSWEKNGDTYYGKVVVGGNSGSINSFTMKYPSKDEKTYDPIVERIYKSFKTPGINEPH